MERVPSTAVLHSINIRGRQVAATHRSQLVGNFDAEDSIKFPMKIIMREGNAPPLLFQATPYVGYSSSLLPKCDWMKAPHLPAVVAYDRFEHIGWAGQKRTASTQMACRSGVVPIVKKWNDLRVELQPQ